MLEIKIDDLNIEILRQDHYPHGEFHASNDIRIKCVSKPEARHDGCGNLVVLFLRGSYSCHDHAPLELYSLSEINEAAQALKEYCDYCGEAFKITGTRMLLK